jgi:hypothetical protein
MPLQKLALRWKKYNEKIEPRSEVKDGLDIRYDSIHDKIRRTGAMCACQLISEEKNNPGTFNGNFARGSM